MEIEQFVRNFENAVDGITPGSLAPDTAFSKLEQWDSLAALTVLAMLDSEYSVELSGKELKQCQTVQDLFAIAATKSATK